MENVSVIMPPKEIGYKGFDKDLKCRGEQFAVGEVYSKPEKDCMKLCSSDGWHYCNKIEGVFNYYLLGDGNRYCEIQVLGNYRDENTHAQKSITTSFRILKEITSEVADTMLEKNMQIETLKKLSISCPMYIIGGSVALFLHGIRLKRWTTNPSGELDIITPYFSIPEPDNGLAMEPSDDYSSGSDFDSVFNYDGVKIDFKVNPLQRYEVVEYKGTKYKVSPMEVILEAKARYAMKGKNKEKHRKDILEMVGKIK